MPLSVPAKSSPASLRVVPHHAREAAARLVRREAVRRCASTSCRSRACGRSTACSRRARYRSTTAYASAGVEVRRRRRQSTSARCAYGKFGDRRVVPCLAVVARDLDQSIVRADPDRARADGATRDIVSIAPPVGGRAVGGARRRPGRMARSGLIASSARRRRSSPHRLESRDQHRACSTARRRSAATNVVRSWRAGSCAGLTLIHCSVGYEILTNPRAAGVHGVRVERIGDDRAPLPPEHRIPVERRDRAEVAAAARADGAGVLLRAVDPVRERVVDGEVVDLLGRLVVPRAPRARRRRA